MLEPAKQSRLSINQKTVKKPNKRNSNNTGFNSLCKNEFIGGNLFYTFHALSIRRLEQFLNMASLDKQAKVQDIKIIMVITQDYFKFK